MAILLSPNISTKISVTINDNISFEIVSTTLSGRLPLRLFSIYRKQEVPFGTFITEFSSLLFNLMQKTSPFIVTGDFNLHINDPSNPMVKQFSDVIEEFGVFLFSTTDPTHISGNVLDFVICDFEAFARLAKPSVDSTQSCSDHFPVSFELDFSCNIRPTVTPTPKRNISSIDSVAFNNDLSETLQNFQDDGEISFFQLHYQYNDLLSTVLNNHAPLKLSSIVRSELPKWFDHELSTARPLRRKLEKAYKRTRDPSDKAALNKSVKAFGELADSKRALYYTKAIADRKGDPRALFSFVAELTDSSSVNVLPTYATNKVVANDINSFLIEKVDNIQHDIAINKENHLFNATNYANTQTNIIENSDDSGPNTSNNIPNNIISNNTNNTNIPNNKIDHTTASSDNIPNIPINKTNNKATNTNTLINITTNPDNSGPHILYEFAPCTQDELSKVISSSKLSTSDLDPLPAAVVKMCVGTLLPHLTVLINCSLRQGSVDGMTEAIIRPLLKKAGLDPDVLLGYRPIANLSLLSKLTERVVHSRINSHMTTNNLHIDSQYGYKKHHGTETLLVHLIDEIMVAVDAKLGVVVLIIDLSAAFDTVNHAVLLKILYREIGIRGTALNWFKSFLTNRTQRVKVGDCLSDPIVLSFGVPQGSVLGPVLFNIYTRSINQKFSAFGFSHHGYADDNAGSKSFSSIFQYQTLMVSIPDLISQLKVWMEDHFLKLNETKTEIIVFGSNSFLSSDLIINGTFTNSGECIRFNDSIKYLGVHLNNSLTLTNHINTITSSAYSYIRKLKGIRQYVSQKDIEILVNAFITSRLDMCNCLFFGLPKASLAKLQKIQNAAVRVIFKLRKRDPVHEHLISLHWLNIEQRIVFKVLLTTFKCLNDMAPLPLTSLLHIKDNSTLLLEVNTFFPSIELGRRAFRYFAPRLWNSIPTDLRVISNVDTFKAKLKTFLFTKHSDVMRDYNKYRC